MAIFKKQNTLSYSCAKNAKLLHVYGVYFMLSIKG